MSTGADPGFQVRGGGGDTKIVWGISCEKSLVFLVVFCGSLFVFFLSVIVLSVLLSFTATDYPFRIF